MQQPTYTPMTPLLSFGPQDGQQQLSMPPRQPLSHHYMEEEEEDIPKPPPKKSSSGGGKRGEGVYYSTLALTTAVPVGIVEALMHYVAIKSGPRAAVVALAAHVSALGGLYAARAATNSSEKIETKKILVTVISSGLLTLISSALVSRLDSRIRGALISSIVVGLAAGLGACGGELISATKK